MKLITLNTWGGRAGKEKLLAFFKKHNDVDIFCLQEIWSAPYENLEGHKAGGKDIEHEQIMVYGMHDISKLMSDHTSFFHPHFLDNYGLQMLVKSAMHVVGAGDIFVYKERGYMPEGDVGGHSRNIQHVTLDIDEKPITVINFHGLWNGKGKTDSGDRIKQTENILEFVKTLSNDFILCGDFNLSPNTKSLKMLEEFGLRNLVNEHGITSTRTSFYKKTEKHADYIFTTKGIDVKDFKVLPDEVSDHAPLLLEFH